ncbi:hypothetical protein [Nocardia sp. 348MFTsu5.1]|uniref:hypothetical protein n=1 Tax=Nocardia sp. 348MFTsu5.1 TaxID=1172185 RepID=UPI00035E9E17|nr:hypothetical protein [Nocardia sp. 348MFTsu5.1]
MAENNNPESESEPTEGVSIGKKPSGKPRRKATATVDPEPAAAEATADEPSTNAPVPGRVESDPKAKSGKQITISLAVVGKVLAGVVVVALLGAVIFFGVNWKSDRAKLDAAADAKAASDYFVTQLLDSMNTSTAGEYVNKMSPLTTGAFRDNLLNEREKTQSDIASMQLKITPEIWSSGVVSNTKDTATTLVVAEITGTSSVATTPVTNLGMFELTLEKHDGKWLVSQMDPGPSSTGVGSTEPGTGADPNATAPAPAPAPAG